MREQPPAGASADLISQAAQFYAIGQYALARQFAQQAGQWLRSTASTDLAAFADATYLLARIELATAQHRQAEELFQQALQVRRQTVGERHPGCVDCLVGLAEVYLRTGDYLRTQRLANQALELAQVGPDPYLVGQASASEVLALLYLAMGDPERAGPLLLQVAQWRTTLEAVHPDLARVQRHLGRIHTRQGQFREAETALERARAWEQRSLGEMHPAHALTLAALADLRLAQGDLDQAGDLYEQSAQCLHATVGEWHPDFADLLDRIGRLALREEEFDEADAKLRRAAAIRRSSASPYHPELANTLTALFRVALVRKEPAQAADLLLEACGIRDRTLGQVLSIGSDRQRTTYLAELRHELDEFLLLVRDHLLDSPQRVGQAYDLVLRRKAVAAEALVTQRTAILAGRYPHLGEALARLDEVRDQIAQKSLAGEGTAELQAEQDRLEGELVRQVPEMNLERRLRAADARAVAEALPADTRLVEFVCVRSGERPGRYLAFVVVPALAEPVRLIDLGESEAIDQQIRVFRAALIGSGDDRGMMPTRSRESTSRPEPGADLPARIWEPLAGALGGCTRLFLCVDGDLTRLPFEVLPHSGSGRLIDRFQLSYLSSGRDLLRLASRSTGTPGPPLILADPDFDAGGSPSPGPGQSCSRDIGGSIARLPGTRQEGERIARLLEVTPCLGGDAVKGRVRAARSPRILHLATHGFFLPDQRLDATSALFLPGRLEDPMLRSGLLLAGFNVWSQTGMAGNGLLTAAEVCTLDLVDTELVVLSACETGLGEVAIGEGVFGLRRAFVLAGARTLVMSLWKVPDEQTQDLMIGFYERVLAGIPRAEALRQAQLALKAHYPDPYFWGAFICQGDPVSLDRPALAKTPPAARSQGPARPGSAEEKLLSAAASGASARVTDLLTQGAAPDTRDARGWTPLHHAAWEGHTEIARRLLDRSADANVAESKGSTPLMLACEKGHEPIARLLLQHRADPSATDGHYWTALMMAIRYPYSEIVRLLLDHGADVNTINRDGDTALMLAAEKGFTEMVRLVLARRPNVNLANEGGNTALTLASYRNHPAIAKQLLEAGADVNAATRHGMTGLLFAAQEGHREVASLLLEHGANVNAQNRDGRTALVWAFSRKDRALDEILRQHGADPGIEDNNGYRASAPPLVLSAEDLRDESRTILSLGLQASKLGNGGQALIEFQRASEADPTWAEPWYSRGVVLAARAETIEALASLRQAVELDPNHAKAWHNQGVLLAGLSQVAEALAAYQSAVKADPAQQQSWHNQAQLLRQLGRTAEALTCHDRAVQLNPEDPLAWFGKGVTLFGDGANYESCQLAEACFVKAQELGHPEATDYLMRCRATILTWMGFFGCGGLASAILGVGIAIRCFWVDSWSGRIVAGVLAFVLLGVAVYAWRRTVGGDEKAGTSG